MCHVALPLSWANLAELLQNGKLYKIIKNNIQNSLAKNSRLSHKTANKATWKALKPSSCDERFRL